MREFRDWQIYYQIEPWGEERADLRTGILASLIANIHRRKGSARLLPRDFMPDFEKPMRKQSVETMAATFKAFAAMHNRQIHGNDNR